MRKAAVLVILILAIFLIIGGTITQSLLILQRVAVVKDARGTIWVMSRGKTEFRRLDPAVDKRVYAGDVIKTEKNGSLTLNWLDGTRISLAPGTTMKVLKCQVNTATKAELSFFKLDVGRIWVRVLKVLSHKSKFEIRTPTATAGVRGTVFSVAVDAGGKTMVSVKEGKVALETSGQSRQEVDGNQMLTTDGRAAQVSGLAQDEAALWQEKAAVAKPNLEMASPAANSTVSPGQPVVVSGQAEIGAKIFVNEQPVSPKLKGRFETTVTVPQNISEFVVKVRVVDARGYESTAEVPLQVK